MCWQRRSAACRGLQIDGRVPLVAAHTSCCWLMGRGLIQGHACTPAHLHTCTHKIRPGAPAQGLCVICLPMPPQSCAEPPPPKSATPMWCTCFSRLARLNRISRCRHDSHKQQQTVFFSHFLLSMLKPVQSQALECSTVLLLSSQSRSCPNLQVRCPAHTCMLPVSLHA